jgi:MFS family permease
MPNRSQPNPMRRVMGLRDFRLLFAGTGLSLLGDQFALIATPWLVLQLTDDPMKLGLVLALEGLSRAAFLLIGGVITDRISPRLTMLFADVLRLLLVSCMAAVVLAGTVQLWMIYAFGFSFGIISGCSVPAENSMVPTLLQKQDLQAGNSIIMGITQLAGFVGPSLAGIVIGAYADSLAGVGIAYGVDAATFGVSAFCLAMIRGGAKQQPVEPEGILAAIQTALAFVWHDKTLRLVFFLLASINFLIIGPLLIGLPIIANDRLPQGAVAYGLLMSAFAAGNLAGFIAAGTLPRPRAHLIRGLIAALFAGFGLVVASIGSIPSLPLDVVLLAFLGFGNGYVAILMLTWLQSRTPEQMLGRVMSFMVFASSGLVPLSQMIAGALGKWNLDLVMFGAGALSILFTIWATSRPHLTIFSNELAGLTTSASR